MWWYDNAISPNVGYDSVIMIDGLDVAVLNEEIAELSVSGDLVVDEIRAME